MRLGDCKYQKTFKNLQETYLKAIDKLNSTPENLADVIANSDAEGMRRINEDNKEAVRYLEELAEMMKEATSN